MTSPPWYQGRVLRHHYSVSRDGDDAPERRFHTFEEADASFTEVAGAVAEGGLDRSGESYWRRRFSGAGGQEVTVALDDRGLTACDARCASD